MGQAHKITQVQWFPPEEDKATTQGAHFANGISWGVSSACGRRDEMEDTCIAVPDLGRPEKNAQGSLQLGMPGGHSRTGSNGGRGGQPPSGWSNTSVFGVFDGHGGDAMSMFCEQQMARTLASYPHQDLPNALKGAFLRVDEMGRSEQQVLNQESGSTAIVCCIREDTICIGNAGDCRAVLCRSGKAIIMSEDHRPTLDQERLRIEAAGGYVEQASDDHDPRVNGDLAVSRALGDYHYKQDKDRAPELQIMSAKPDVETFQRSRKDEFLVLASDGIWDVLNSQAVVDWVRPRLGRQSDMEDRLNDGVLDLGSIAEGLIDHCLAPRLQLLNGLGEDNMTVILIVFNKSFWRAANGERSRESFR